MSSFTPSSGRDSDAAAQGHSEDIYGGRSLDEIRETGAAWITEKELERLCERIDYLEDMKRCNESAPSPPATFCDRWPGHDGPHRNAHGEWGKDSGRLDAA